MVQKQDEIKIVVGAGEYNNNPGWIHTQEKELDLLDKKTWDHKFEKNSITAILAEHVWEHLTYEEGIEAAMICFQYLKPQGYVRCAVPDGFFPDESYQNVVKVGGPGPIDHPAVTHKMVFNYKTLSEVFKTAGYKIDLLEYCDENGIFHEKEWAGKDGVIFRSKRYDPRNREKMTAPSLIIDAIKE